MAAKKWQSPMMRGRGLRTINAMPAAKPSSRIPLLPGQLAAPRRLPRKPLSGPVWHVPGFEQLAILAERRDGSR
jgi:hypothetical protein